MARPLRIEFPGAWYHVMNRGTGRQIIFNKPDDFQYFLKLLLDINSTYKIEVHAYCLMNNHYHLLIRTPHGMLSRSIRYLNGMYARYYNKTNKSDGSVFKGRYKAILIDAENYFLQVSRYIHLNPVEAKLVTMPEKYTWSSCQYYVNSEYKPEWLSCNETLARFNGNSNVKYMDFVKDGIDTNGLDIENQTISTILGTKEFIDKAKRYSIGKGGLEEISDYKLLMKVNLITIEDVIKAVASYFNVSQVEIIDSVTENFHIQARKVAVYLAVKLTGQTQINISKMFYGIGYKGISKVKTRMEIELRNNLELTKIINDIVQKLPSYN